MSTPAYLAPAAEPIAKGTTIIGRSVFGFDVTGIIEGYDYFFERFNGYYVRCNTNGVFSTVIIPADRVIAVA